LLQALLSVAWFTAAMLRLADYWFGFKRL